MCSRWWHGTVADLAAALLLTTVMLAATMASTDHPARPVDAVVVVAMIAIGGWVAVARRMPRTALIGACVTFFAALAIGVPGFSPALALGFPLFVAARAGHLWWGVAVVSWIAVSGVSYRLLGEGAEPLPQVAVGSLFDVALVTVIVLLGETLRSRRQLSDEAQLRLRITEREHQQRITAERLRTSRDLHDVLAHTVTVVGIQANVAAESIEDRPERARAAIESVRVASKDALSDLRSTIAVLRADGSANGGPRAVPGLNQVPDLLDTTRAAGMAASLHIDGDRTGLRPSVALAVYRVVQESLTNALRHSSASTVTVAVDCAGDAVRVTVRDDGKQAAEARPVAGSGLRGMTERVTALGGTVRYGPADNGKAGWVVRVHLPVRGASCP
ncbi:MAG: hypothetical protein GEU86_11230 [Actinophytocola sp.]|nr:hypothetical protein [Actinophytocola sp.]